MKQILIISMVLFCVLFSAGVFGLTTVSSCGTLNTAGEIYKLNQSFAASLASGGVCILINNSHITFDCDSLIITGNTNGTGIAVNSNMINETIKNCNILNFSKGINLDTCNDSTIQNNNLTLNSYGIYLSLSSNNTIYNNNASANTAGSGRTGIYLAQSIYNNLSNNIANNNKYGIYIFSSSNSNSISGNTANSNTFYGIYIFSSSNSNSISGNTANSNAHGIYFQTSSTNNSVSGNTALYNSNTGIYFAITNCDYNNLSNNNVSNNLNGIYLSYNLNNTLTNNTASSNTQYGVWLISSSGNVLIKNKISSNSQGVRLSSGGSNNSNNNISLNDIFNNTDYDVLIAGGSGNILIKNWWGTTTPDSSKFNLTDGVSFPEDISPMLDNVSDVGEEIEYYYPPNATENIHGTNLSTGFDSRTVQTVSNYIWQINGKGKVKWSQTVNLSELNLDYLINLDNNFFSVNSSAEPKLNKPAQVRFDGVDCSKCNDNFIVYADGAYNDVDSLRLVAKSCRLSGKCSNFACSGGNCTFNVIGFTGYAYGGNSNLTINDSAEGSSVNTGVSVIYYAYYVNATNGSLISGSCNVTDDNGVANQAMTAGGSYYWYNKTGGYSSGGIHNWNVTCAASGYTELSANDTINITGGISYMAVPEFSDYAMILIIVTAICGFYFVKRRRFE